MSITYKTICDKLGCDLKDYFTNYEEERTLDDTPTPAQKLLSLDELDWWSTFQINMLNAVKSHVETLLQIVITLKDSKKLIKHNDLNVTLDVWEHLMLFLWYRNYVNGLVFLVSNEVEVPILEDYKDISANENTESCIKFLKWEKDRQNKYN